MPSLADVIRALGAVLPDPGTFRAPLLHFPEAGRMSAWILRQPGAIRSAVAWQSPDTGVVLVTVEAAALIGYLAVTATVTRRAYHNEVVEWGRGSGPVDVTGLLPDSAGRAVWPEPPEPVEERPS